VEKILLTPIEAAAMLSIGRTKLYELMRTGDLFSVRLGGIRRIPRESFEAFVSRFGQSVVHSNANASSNAAAAQ
jgi:excisionase family DNA binding protein